MCLLIKWSIYTWWRPSNFYQLGEKFIEVPELQAMIRSFSLNPEWFELFCYTLYIAHQYKYIFKKYFNSLISLILISKGSFTMKMKISLTSNIIEVRHICYVEMTCRYVVCTYAHCTYVTFKFCKSPVKRKEYHWILKEQFNSVTHHE